MARVAVVVGLSGLILMTLGQVSAFNACVGDASTSLGDGQCYSLFYKTMLTPSSAESACQALTPTTVLPSHLATVKNVTENNLLQKLLQNNYVDAIIGFQTVSGSDKWVDTTASVTYMNKATSYTSNPNACSGTTTNSYMSKVDGKWRTNCGADMAYVCRTHEFDPCAPPFASVGWTNVYNRCFRLLTSKERKGAEHMCRVLEPAGKSVMYDFDDDSDFVTDVLTALNALPQGNYQEEEFWLDEEPLYPKPEPKPRPGYNHDDDDDSDNYPRNYNSKGDNDGPGYNRYKRDAGNFPNMGYNIFKGYDIDDQDDGPFGDYKGPEYNYKGSFNYPGNYKGPDNYPGNYKGPDNYKGTFKGPDNYPGNYKGNDKGYPTKGYSDKGYNDKGYSYNRDPLKCLAGVVKGNSPPRFSVEKYLCKKEYNVICELKVQPPMTTATSG